MYYMLRNTRLYSKQRVHAFPTGPQLADLHAHLLTGVKRGTCADCGVSFDLQPPPANKSRNPLAPSPGRYNPATGYSVANVRVTCWSCNMAQGESTMPEYDSWLHRAYNFRFRSDH